MEAQFKKDQGGQQVVKESSSVLDCLGYDVNGRDYKTFINIQYSTDNNVISNAGQANLSAGTTCTINIQDQCVHYLKRYAIAYQFTCQNGYIPNYLSMVEGRQVQIGKKTVSTGDSRFLQMIKFGIKNKSKQLKYMRGLGLKMDDQYASGNIQKLQLVPITNPPATDLPTLSLAVNQQLQLPLFYYGFTTVQTGNIRSDDAPNFVTDYNLFITTPMNAYGYNLTAVDGANFAAIFPLVNAQITQINLVQASQPVNQVATRWQQYEQAQLANQANQCKGPYTFGNAQVYSAVIPLHYIFNNIELFKGSGALPLLNGNTAQFQFTFNLPSYCMIATQAGILNYSVSNLQLIRAMSPELNSQQIANIQSSSIQFPVLKGYSCQQQQMVGTVNLTASIPYNSRCHGFYFVFAPNDNTSSTNTATNLCDSAATENVVSQQNGAYSRLQCPLNFAIPLPIRQVVLSVAGQTRVLNAYLVQNVEQIQYIEKLDSAYGNALDQQIKTYYRIDMDRFSEDLFGSNLDPSPLNVIIEFAGGQFTISGQGSAWNFEAPANNQASTQRFQCRAYVELQEYLALEGGQWRM